MPNIEEYYATSGGLLKGEDFVDTDDIELTIDRVAFEPFNSFDNPGEKEIKPVIYFKETDKRLKVNFFHKEALIAITGTTETNNWSGTKITIGHSRAKAGGQMRDTIAIREPVRKGKGKLPKFAVKKMDERNPPELTDKELDEMNDEIPF